MFKQTIGGLAWPGMRDGFLVVVGEKADRPKRGRRRPLVVFHEAYSKSLVDLARECATLEKLYCVKGWWARIEGEAAGYESRFYDLAREYDARLNVCQTSLPEKFGLALQILRQRFLENGLLLMKGGILTERLVGVNHEDPGQKDLYEKYPEVMVQATCVSELDSSPIGEEEDPDAWRNRVSAMCLGRNEVGGY